MSAGAVTFGVHATSLVGVVLVDDTFTIAGESGSPLHTVTGIPGTNFYPSVSNAITGITFTPAIATGGVAANAAVTFTSNLVSQVTDWSLTTALGELDTTTMGSQWKTIEGGLASWSGQVKVKLDYANANQADLINRISSNALLGQAVGLVLGVQFTSGSATKFFYGYGLVKTSTITSQINNIVEATISFTGSGAVSPTWV